MLSFITWRLIFASRQLWSALTYIGVLLFRYSVVVRIVLLSVYCTVTCSLFIPALWDLSALSPAAKVDMTARLRTRMWRFTHILPTQRCVKNGSERTRGKTFFPRSIPECARYIFCRLISHTFAVIRTKIGWKPYLRNFRGGVWRTIRCRLNLPMYRDTFRS